MSSSTRHKRKASALLKRLLADSASRPIFPASIASLTSRNLRASASLFFIENMRAQASSIVSVLARFLAAAFDRLSDLFSAGLRIFIVSFCSFFSINVSASVYLFDIHFEIIVADFFDIILVPFIEARSIAHVMLRQLVEKKVGGEAFSPAVDAVSARFFAHFWWLESTHLYRPSRMLELLVLRLLYINSSYYRCIRSF